MASNGRPTPAVCQPSPTLWETLTNAPNPGKPSKTLNTLTWHASSCSQQPPQGHTSMAFYGPLKQSLGQTSSSQPASCPRPHHRNGLLWSCHACRLSSPSDPSRHLDPENAYMLWEILKTLTWHASSCSQQLPRGHTSMASYGPLKQSLGMLHPAANRHPKATHQWLLMGFPRSNPSRSPQAAPRPHRVNIFLPCFVLQFRLPGIWA